MCGILAALGLTEGDPEKRRRLVLRCSKLLRHRGPDANSVYQSADGHNFIAFERLQIIDVTDGGRCAYACSEQEWAAACMIFMHDLDDCAPCLAGSPSSSRRQRGTLHGRCESP